MRRRLILCLAPIWMVCILVGSFIPTRTKSVIGTTRQIYFLTIFGRVIGVNPHRVIHIFAFGGAACMLMLLARTLKQRIAAGVAAFLMAMATEAGEYSFFHNQFEWLDIRDDLMGIVAALILVQLLALMTDQIS